jgi:hypothetical protein
MMLMGLFMLGAITEQVNSVNMGSGDWGSVSSDLDKTTTLLEDSIFPISVITITITLILCLIMISNPNSEYNQKNDYIQKNTDTTTIEYGRGVYGDKTSSTEVKIEFSEKY